MLYLVCAADSDITISSSDGVLFKVHRKNLEVHSDVFASAEHSTRPPHDEVVHLTETAAVLELLFQYMYRQPQPNLNVVEFPVVAGLAEAAEKYVVYSALEWCKMKMKWVLFYERWHEEKIKFLGGTMSKYEKDIPLLGKCIVELNPFSTYRDELEKRGYKSIIRDMMDIRFMPESESTVEAESA
ncbi:hypothetical protein R3P38DRAFT_2843831 [Favolaschia claudopus]|uniref:BTB domain-containing protein n=1 Tax=Favolaschia claudopus TaxID=2862362 RepID=A0AAW0E5F4_9AGAR